MSQNQPEIQSQIRAMLYHLKCFSCTRYPIVDTSPPSYVFYPVWCEFLLWKFWDDWPDHVRSVVVTLFEHFLFQVCVSAECCRWLCSCSQGLADNCVIARVDDELWDLDRPLEKDCSLELLRFDSEDAQAVSVWRVAVFPCRLHVFFESPPLPPPPSLLGLAWKWNLL